MLIQESSCQQDTGNNWPSFTINSCNRTSTQEGIVPNLSPFSSTDNNTLPPTLPYQVEAGNAQPGPFHTGTSVDKMESHALQSNEAMVEASSTTILSTAFSNHTEFLDPDSVSMASITVTVAPFVNQSHKIQILHRDIPMHIRCDGMKIRFGLSTQFVDHIGNPRLSFVVDASSSNLCSILDACDDTAKRFVDHDANSQWRPVVSKTPGFYNSPTIRLHLPTAAEDTSRCITEIYYKNSSAVPCTQQLVSSRYADVAEVNSFFRPAFLVNAYFSLEPYNAIMPRPL